MENSFLQTQAQGIKLLLSMKGNIDEEIDPEKLRHILEDLEEQEIEFKNENYVEEITDEEFNKNVREMDNLIMDIIRTKQKLRLGKLKSKIKTKEDLLNFLNIRDKDDNKIPPEPRGSSSGVLIEKLKININSERENEFSNIKEKLMKQEQLRRGKEVGGEGEEKNLNLKSDSYLNLDNINKYPILIPEAGSNNNSLKVAEAAGGAGGKNNFFITNSNLNITESTNLNSYEMTLLYEEIKKAESRCDDLLDDIDECIKMGEDLDDIIEKKYTG